MRKNVCGFIVLFIMASCGVNKKSAPDVSMIDVEFDIIRTEQELMNLDTSKVPTGILKMAEEYPEFMDIYLNNIMGFASKSDSAILFNNIKGFIQAEHIQELYTVTQKSYGDFNSLKNEFETAFKYYQFYFPSRDIPDLYTFISEYGFQRFIFLDEEGRDAVGIGLDLFLGSEYPYHEFVPNNPAFSDYLVRRYNKEHLVKRIIEALLEDILGNPSDNNMLSKMIHNGKKIYMLDHILPYTNDTIIMEYTPEQLNWCVENELEMWAYFLKEDLFYETDINKINKLVNPSPNSPGMPEIAPGRTGNYIGWKIVEAYMRIHPEITIEELVGIQDAQAILKDSKFKPRK